jgi:hypothetical protein
MTAVAFRMEGAARQRLPKINAPTRVKEDTRMSLQRRPTVAVWLVSNLAAAARGDGLQPLDVAAEVEELADQAETENASVCYRRLAWWLREWSVRP